MQKERFTTVRTDSRDPDFRLLVEKLDAELSLRDGPDHSFYHQFNGIEDLDRVVVAYEGSVPVACGALKPFGGEAMEIKRMFVLQLYRGKGAAQKVIHALEEWARESGLSRCVLETGKRQPEAIAFYQKTGYVQIENYGPYRGIENSLCFEKCFEEDQ
ncbi:GNAT family N-acetyltransferase [Robiginitalea sp.]|uniref:GNAT family N-acetyltransferase n=1 Tax=Robiginitalea sp. TaxID=1902411 RepID=UPI003C76E89F